MAAFILILLWKKVPGLVTRGLDNQIAAIRTRLDDAKQLRAEAEALRDEYARKIAGAEAEAAAMLAHADEEAKGVLAKAEADARDLTARRAKMAEDKIGAAERAALQAIRAKAADAATKAAAAIIAEKHGATPTRRWSTRPSRARPAQLSAGRRVRVDSSVEIPAEARGVESRRWPGYRLRTHIIFVIPATAGVQSQACVRL
jgi:F0F1-type ATP synthase membrane subunit b/b'